jgi:hypothetical protein
MALIMRETEIKNKSKGRRMSELSIEDRLLIALEDIREYRAYFF